MAAIDRPLPGWYIRYCKAVTLQIPRVLEICLWIMRQMTVKVAEILKVAPEDIARIAPGKCRELLIPPIT